MRAAVAARLARRPPKAEPAAAPVAREEDDGDEVVTDATFDERMRAKVLQCIVLTEPASEATHAWICPALSNMVLPPVRGNDCSGDSQNLKKRASWSASLVAASFSDSRQCAVHCGADVGEAAGDGGPGAPGTRRQACAGHRL